MSTISGYAGKLLRVNLTTEKLSDAPLDEEILKNYIGGTCLGVKILYDKVDPRLEWSDPSNVVVIASGPLGSTRFPGSGTVSVVTKGALTNGATAVQANGYFGAFLKFCGYDGVVIQGAARRWLYLHIDDDEVELREASHLLGRDTYETADLIKQELGQRDLTMSVASIGPAAEHLCRFCGVFIDKGHAAAHNGPGTVMGSKRLKAIAVARGSRQVEVKDPEGYKELTEKFMERPRSFRGTIDGVYTGAKNPERGTLPIKNYQTDVWDIDEERLNRYSEKYIRETFKVQPHSCYACPATHCQMMTITEGPYAGTEVEEPEYEQLAAFGPVIDNKDMASAAMLASLNDRLGFENNEMGWLMGWVIECYEKGCITSEMLGGLKMTWGNAEAVRQLMHMIANRESFGNVLSMGVMRASQRLGGEAANLAIYTRKGNTPRGHDHRNVWGEMFDTTVSNTGTLETHTALVGDAARAGNPMATSTAVAITKGLMEFDDSLGVCRFNSGFNIPLEVEAVNAVTGWRLSAETAKEIGLRAVNLMKVFNLRVGITKDLDYPSERYGSTPVDGPFKGVSIQPHWEAMLDNYYKLMGWDPRTSKPLPETLRNLGLGHVIKDIW